MGAQSIGVRLTPKIIEAAWIKLIGQKNFDSLKIRINEKGEWHKEHFFPRPFSSDFIVENYDIKLIEKEYHYKPKLLTDLGWLLDFSELINLEIDFDSNEIEYTERIDCGAISIIPKTIL